MKSVNWIGGIHLPSGKHVLGMKKARHIFGTAKVGDRGQIVIPKDAREFYGIHPGDTLLILGDEENGVAPGTKWEDVPEDFVCPICGLGKDAFTEE